MKFEIGKYIIESTVRNFILSRTIKDKMSMSVKSGRWNLKKKKVIVYFKRLTAEME